MPLRHPRGDIKQATVDLSIEIRGTAWFEDIHFKIIRRKERRKKGKEKGKEREGKEREEEEEEKEYVYLYTCPSEKP